MSAARALYAGGAVAAMVLGYGLLLIMSPGEERRVKSLSQSSPVTTEESRRRTALVMQAMKDAAATNDNLATGRGVAAK
ncbi:ubiquinol-cytochrome-c reductase complex assembly factor 3 [Pseudoliparis swirei]|uniref:ubiquinol-cytochrome-c reductase complex assembly factor 3 n=1 Tax=Pseudoliparis swirei TaxID=2059687 RepID=UPI0024BEDEE4|nr:ubiquinol-cytochrome-c reductase complex assembly factor 3 [Pseudoliparis swirei]